MRKNFLTGIVAGFLMLIVAMIISQLSMTISVLSKEYSNASLFRAINDPVTLLFFIHPFLIGIILSFIWNKTKSIIDSGKFLTRGIKFGLIYWLVVLPGLIISYACSPYSLIMIISWAVSVFLQAISAGMIFEKLNS